MKRSRIAAAKDLIVMARTARFRLACVVVAAAVVNLVALTVPSLVADTGRGVDADEASNSRIGVPGNDDEPQHQSRHDLSRPLLNEVDPSPTTGSGRDHRPWLTNPAATAGSDRAGHQQGRLYRPDKPHLAGSHVVADTRSLERSPSMNAGSHNYAQIALGGLVGAVMVATVAATVGRRRWSQKPLEAALASDDSDELPRAAGLLGDRFVQQDRAGAAEHAYRAAIDVGDQYWSPIAQVALAQLLSDRDQREEAQALLEAAIASGHPRTASMAQATLSELSTDEGNHAAIRPSPKAYEILGDSTSCSSLTGRQRRPAVVVISNLIRGAGSGAK